MNTLGLKPKNKHHTNPEIKELSEKQKNLKLKLDNTIDNTTKNTIKKKLEPRKKWSVRILRNSLLVKNIFSYD